MKKCMWTECSRLTSNPKFCSLSCGAKHQHANKVRETRVRACARPECDNTWEVSGRNREKQYCSRSCSATVNNAGVVRHGVRKYNPCCRCQAPTKRKFCSSICSAKYRSEEKIRLWLNGEWDGASKQGLARPIRMWLIEQAENKCASPACAVPGGFAEINPVTGRCPLEVDHLDGNCYNNSRENLMVVCPNYHALTPTYRALNKGSGRAYRRLASVIVDERIPGGTV